MRRSILIVGLGLAVLVASPASAGWKATTPQATEAVKDARIQAVLAQTSAMDRAILANDVDAFDAFFSDDAQVNNPSNKIASKAVAMTRMRTGLIDYRSIERFVEYAGVRPNGEVLLMGEEVVTPIRKAGFAGKTARRRTTEVWTPVGSEWKLSVRQATVYEAK